MKPLTYCSLHGWPIEQETAQNAQQPKGFHFPPTLAVEMPRDLLQYSALFVRHVLRPVEAVNSEMGSYQPLFGSKP